MRGRLIVLVISIFILGNSFAQNKKLKVYLNQNQFYTPDGGNYVVTHLDFVGGTLFYVDKDSNTFAEVSISQSFSFGDSTIILDKYLLKSPPVFDSIFGDFHDIQRYALKPGAYTYNLVIQDVNSKQAPLQVSKSVVVKDLSKSLAFSPILPAISIRPAAEKRNIFTRMGYDVVPKLGTYYPTELNYLLYYVELYNTNSYLTGDSVYVIRQELLDNDKKLNLYEYTRYYRYTSAPLQPISKAIDISMLPTGSFTLKLSVLDRNKSVLATQELPFSRTNTAVENQVDYSKVVLDPAFDASIPSDSSAYYVASIIPIAKHEEVRNIIRILKKKDSSLNLRYLQAFWKQVNPLDPYTSWIKYKAQVKMVERLFATNFKAGFETDRGRVYLQYGPPSSVIDRPSSPSEYPYIIWQYDHIKQYNNRRFVFYNPTNLNNYQLLHSDMLGELHNYRWQYILNKRNTPGGNGFDDPTGGTPDHFGQFSWRDYNTF